MEYLGFFGLALVMAGLSAGFVLYPLQKTQTIKIQSAPQANLLKAQEQREQAYAALLELDQDLALGDMSQDDYQELRTLYKQQAVEALISLDKQQAQQHELAAEIERAVVKARRRIEAKALSKTSTTAQTAGTKVALKDRAECTRCGSRTAAGAVYCAKCGAKI